MVGNELGHSVATKGAFFVGKWKFILWRKKLKVCDVRITICNAIFWHSIFDGVASSKIEININRFQQQQETESRDD